MFVATYGDPVSRQAAENDRIQRNSLRGTIYDRDGNALNYSKKIGGKRYYDGGHAFSTVTGYFSQQYGTFGVEKALNTELVYTKGNRGEEHRGADVTLTTDSDLQHAAYDAISNIASGAAVVLDVRTGEILALASTPTFDPSKIDDEWEDITQTDGLFLPNAYRKTFAPGSDFKIISACAVIDNGVDLQTVYDEGFLTFKNGQTITNYHSNAYGELDLDEAIVRSSNVYFMQKAMDMGGEALEKSIRKFLIGENIPLDFTTLKSNLDFEDYRDEVIASIAFGQGATEVTPLHMAMAAQAIANDGVMLKPYLIKSVVSPSGSELVTGKSETLSTVTSKTTADRVTSAMTQAANEYGFGYFGPEGWDIAAKTGTAETGKGNYNGWIVTFAPSESPKYAVVVMAAAQDYDGIYYKESVDRIYNALTEYDANR